MRWAPRDRNQAEDLIRQEAEKRGLDCDLCVRLCEASSGFDHSKIAPGRGCFKTGDVGPRIGLFQITDDEAGQFDCDAEWWRENVKAGISKLRFLVDRYDGRVERAVAAFLLGSRALDDLLRRVQGDWRTALPPGMRDSVDRVLNQRREVQNVI